VVAQHADAYALDIKAIGMPCRAGQHPLVPNSVKPRYQYLNTEGGNAQDVLERLCSYALVLVPEAMLVCGRFACCTGFTMENMATHYLKAQHQLPHTLNKIRLDC